MGGGCFSCWVGGRVSRWPKPAVSRNRPCKDSVETLLAAGADCHRRDAEKQTALHWAARGHPEVAYVLLAFGAEADVQETGRGQMGLLFIVWTCG